MSSPATPSQPAPAGDDRNLVPAEASPVVTFEDKIRGFWASYRKAIYGLCALVVLAIVGKGALEYFEEQREEGVRKAYAAATTPDQLKSFAAANAAHSLAGVAHLRMADDAYKAGKAADAVAGYEKAAGILKSGPLAARARLGLALSNVLAGKSADGAKVLGQVAADEKEFKAVRAEAIYHLCSLAAEAGQADEVQKRVDELMKLDVSSPWTQRAMSLRASLPPSAAPAAPAADAKKDAAAAPAGVQVKVPGK
ncbi:MAG: hypothetical protein ACKPB0_15800 [Opitutaceae bacterium]